jgi:16S rRNA (guanine527-N7)-methyltransferase
VTQQAAVRQALERAKALGFLGPGPVEEHLTHAQAYQAAVPGPFAGAAADLGSGGGVPALPLALAWPDSTWVLLERSERRAAFLDDAVRTLGLAGRVEVRAEPAERAGRDPELRGSLQLVVARSFGVPAVVAECAAPLLEAGGHLVVSEPPSPDLARWPSDDLARLGLGPARLVTSPTGTVALLHQTTPCPTRYPRTEGKPSKAPLFRS